MRRGHRRIGTSEHRSHFGRPVPVSGARCAGADDRRIGATEASETSATPAHHTPRTVGAPMLSVVLVALACTAPTIRPSYGPLPAAAIDTLPLPADSAIVLFTARLTAAGLRVRRASPAEGYLETDWFDLRAQRPVAPDQLQTDRVVRVRVFADPEPPGRSRVVVETVYRRTADPSAPGREEEIVAPPGHPGDSLTQHLLRGLRVAGAEERR